MEFKIFFIVLLIFSTANYCGIEGNEANGYTLAVCQISGCKCQIISEEGGLSLDKISKHFEIYHGRTTSNYNELSDFFKKHFRIYNIQNRGTDLNLTPETQSTSTPEIQSVPMSEPERMTPIQSNSIKTNSTHKICRRYICPEHDKAYKAHSSMCTHLKKFHGSSIIQNQHKRYLCECNPKKLYSTKREANKHLEKYHNTILEKEFSDPSLLWQNFFFKHQISKPLPQDFDCHLNHEMYVKYFCKAHNKVYESEHRLWNHLRNKHDPNIKTTACTDYKIYVCGCDPQKFYTSENE